MFIYVKYDYPNTTPIYNDIPLIAPGIADDSTYSLEENFNTAALTESSNEGNYFYVFPNPSTENASINFRRSTSSDLTVSIYDLSGHLIKVIAEDLDSIQDYSFQWNLIDDNGSDVPTGIYFVSLKSESLEETRTVVVCR